MNHRTLIEKFVKGSTHGQASNMYIKGDTLYSYGEQFPLLVRMPWGFLQNADKRSVSTSRHQGLAARHATALIPFSILRRMDVNYNSIALIDKTAARYDMREYVNDKGETVKVEERRPESVLFSAHKKFYIASMDNNNYFATLLPKRAKNVEEAFALLTPKEARNNPAVKRQGEWFFIPVSAQAVREYCPLALHAEGRPLLKNRNPLQAAHHGVTHMGLAKSIRYPLVRGTVRHTQGDHPRLSLGKVWHIAVESNHIISFGVNGRID